MACKIENQAHTLGASGLNSMQAFYASSVFRFFFQANLIIINYPHQPSLAKSGIQKGGRKTLKHPNCRCTMSHLHTEIDHCFLILVSS